MGRISMEITEIECKILRIKAGAILILGMQLGSELQLDTEQKRQLYKKVVDYMIDVSK